MGGWVHIPVCVYVSVFVSGAFLSHTRRRRTQFSSPPKHNCTQYPGRLCGALCVPAMRAVNNTQHARGAWYFSFRNFKRETLSCGRTLAQHARNAERVTHNHLTTSFVRSFAPRCACAHARDWLCEIVLPGRPAPYAASTAPTRRGNLNRPRSHKTQGHSERESEWEAAHIHKM